MICDNSRICISWSFSSVLVTCQSSVIRVKGCASQFGTFTLPNNAHYRHALAFSSKTSTEISSPQQFVVWTWWIKNISQKYATSPDSAVDRFYSDIVSNALGLKKNIVIFLGLKLGLVIL